MTNQKKEITLNANSISVLAAKSTGKEITTSQGTLPLGIEIDYSGKRLAIGMTFAPAILSATPRARFLACTPFV